MTIELSCAFATSPESHEHARIAESLGYRRAFFFDSPALYPDVWVQLCRAAERTERIGLGPGVLIPSLRHPMTNAATIATLAGLAGAERVIVGVGSGFTGRMALGQRAMRWRDVAAYVHTLRGLLRGEQVRWDGKLIEMLHTPGFAPPRPIEVPFIIAAGGPKGIAVAREVGDGVALPVGPCADRGNPGRAARVGRPPRAIDGRRPRSGPAGVVAARVGPGALRGRQPCRLGQRGARRVGRASPPGERPPEARAARGLPGATPPRAHRHGRPARGRACAWHPAPGPPWLRAAQHRRLADLPGPTPDASPREQGCG